MDRNRLTAFTDSVLAVIITIMVLEMKPPHGARLHDLLALGPVYLSYVLSFIYLASYWNNHHHFFHLVHRVDGAILWANLHLVFWLSTVPFATAWMGENGFAPVPTALYGGVLLMAALAWYLMQTLIVRGQGPDSALARALGRDLKGKLSLVFYLVGIGLAFVNTAAAGLVYLGVALTWLVPDRRVEAAIRRGDAAGREPP
jgi:TMEM175 potassium channel family protein